MVLADDFSMSLSLFQLVKLLTLRVPQCQWGFRRQSDAVDLGVSLAKPESAKARTMHSQSLFEDHVEIRQFDLLD